MPPVVTVPSNRQDCSDFGLDVSASAPRCFFAPGPLSGGHVGLLDEHSESGGVAVKALDLSGETWWTEAIQGRGAKMMVAP